MSANQMPDKLPELSELLQRLVDDQLEDVEMRRLGEILRNTPGSEEFYDQFVTLHCLLTWQYAPPLVANLSPISEGECLAPHETLHDAIVEPSCAVSDHAGPPLFPAQGFFSSALHGPVSYFSQEIPFSLLVGAAITSLLVLVAWLVPVSRLAQVAKNASSIPTVNRQQTNSIRNDAMVGQITGMANVKWSKDCDAPSNYGNVLIGHRFSLDSGLLEITYNTGARVILEGPVTYEADSCNGGYLTVGKLTARLEKRGERRGESKQQGSEVRGQGPEQVASGQWLVASETNPKSQITKSQISNPLLSPAPRPQSPAPMFAVRTPTATVTDLGTEFGVEVNKEGHTASHVFQGSIQVQAISDSGKLEGVARVLHENESAYVDHSSIKMRKGERITVAPSTDSAAAFIREIPRSTTKTFDLVDVVAGGDGFSQRRNRGISSSTGEVITRALRDDEVPPGDGLYHRVPWSPLIDGVFVPDGRKGAVQTDSVGHTFDGFSNLTNQTASSVWAGGKILAADPTLNIPTVLNGVDYSSKDHGLLFMHANKAVTFNLDAIRQANPGFKITRFLTMSSSMEGSVDAWFLVDGKERFSRCKISQSYSAMPITIPIRENEHFLTLAVTDGGDGIGGDWMIFGDPQLEMISIRAVPDAKK